jgi:hypothetical protein
MKDMDKEFSEGFMQDLADLLEFCMENKTDSMELDFNYGGKHLKVDITFSISEVE